ncbi:MAG: dTMP kinase [Coriobacteriia bacterium]|uniref:dTMP kinase n=1 Tax=Paratractidigestivibacter sp. TaxID=2847316 RepID=UPI000D7AFA66|nr:MAG: dTMP kinase [Coriobacteriia bacterium]
MRGLFITLEGADGCGKSTQAAILADRIAATGREVVRLREPGGTAVSEKIRALVLDPENSEMAPECELLLFEASRAQLVRQVIEPALARGAVVVCDRFYDSTFAYQAAGRSLAEQTIRAANALGSCGVAPDRTLVLDMDTDAALSRATRDGADRMEAEGVAFQRRVREGYLRLVAEEPRRVRRVDATGTVEEVAGRLADALADLLPDLAGEDR